MQTNEDFQERGVNGYMDEKGVTDEPIIITTQSGSSATRLLEQRLLGVVWLFIPPLLANSREF